MQTEVTGVEQEGYEQGEVLTEGESIELIEVPPIIPEAKFTIGEEQVIQRRTMTRDETRQVVMDLFAQRKELDYAELMSELGLDLEVVVDVCRELEKEGKIEAIAK